MKNNIETLILTDLYMASDYLPIDYFTQKYDYSKRSIRQFMTLLRDEADIEYKRNKGYILLNKSDIDLNELYRNSQDIFSKDVRIIVEMIMLVYQIEPVSLQMLADLFYISKTSAKNDMDKIKAYLSNRHIDVYSNQYGHYIEAPFEVRINIILDLLTEKAIDVELIDSIFSFLFPGINYVKIFKVVSNHLLNHDVLVNDEVLIRFVNYIILASQMDSKTNNEHIEIHHYDKWFYELETDLSKLLLINDYEIYRKMYYTFVLRIPTLDIKRRAKSILNEYTRACKIQFGFEYNEFDRNLLLNFFQEWIIDDQNHTHHNRDISEDIKRFYVGAFEMALLLSYIMEVNGYKIEENNLAYFALVLNDLIVKRNKAFDVKVHIIVIYNCDIFIYYHIQKTIENTIDQRLYTIEGMNLYRFNRIRDKLDKEKTIILDVDDRANLSGLNYNFTSLKLNPMMFGDDIEKIKALVIKKRIEYYDAYTYKMIQNSYKYIEIINQDQLDNIFSNIHYVLNDGILIQKINSLDAYIDIIHLNEKVKLNDIDVDLVIRYSYGSEFKLISHTKNFIIKYLDKIVLDKCKDKETFIKVIDDYYHE